MNNKSDIPAKQAFLEKLNSDGYKAEIKAQPSDIVAEKNGVKWYYEIKMTRKESICFGAATLTEWEQAFKTPDRFRFVIAMQDNKGNFSFQEYSPSEFMKYSTIPPFKVYFNIPLQEKATTRHQKRHKAIPLTEWNFEKMLRLFNQMKADNNSH